MHGRPLKVRQPNSEIKRQPFCEAELVFHEHRRDGSPGNLALQRNRHRAIALCDAEQLIVPLPKYLKAKMRTVLSPHEIDERRSSDETRSPIVFRNSNAATRGIIR